MLYVQQKVMKDAKYHIALLAANLVFGANYSFYSGLIGGHYISSDSLYVLRTLAAALFFIPMMFLSKRWRVDYKDLYKFLIVAALLLFGRMFLMLEGMNYTSPIDGSIIATMGPILIMIIAAFMIRERITLTRLAGIVLGAAGALILIFSNAGHHTSLSGKMLGNLLILASIVFSSIDTVYIKQLFSRYSPYTVMGWAYLFGLFFVLPVFGDDLLRTDLSRWTPQVYGSMIWLLLGGTVLSTVLLFYGLRGVTATASSIYVYTQPVIATLLAILRGQDKLTVVTISSAALIFAGVFFVIRSYKQSPPPPPAPRTHIHPVN